MIFYTINYLSILLIELTKKNKSLSNFSYLLICYWTIFAIGFRDEIGVDWPTYLYIFDNSSSSNWLDFQTDPLYHILSKISNYFGFGIYGINFICAAIGTLPIFSFLKRSENFHISIIIAYSYLLTVVAMGYTRQYAAIGLICLAYIANFENKTTKVLLWSGLASLMHFGALCVVPLLLIRRKYIFRTSIILLIIGAAAYSTQTEKIFSIIDLYSSNDLSSSGLLIRSAPHFLTSLTIFININKINSKYHDIVTNYLLYTSIIIILALFLPSATFLDRILVYLLPLQCFFIAKISGKELIKEKWMRFFTKIIFVTFFISTFFIWLNFSHYQASWIPYKNIFYSP